MTGYRRPSPQTAAVLRALAAAPSKWRYGYELGQEVSLKAGSLYPILMRLADRGLLETTWEPDPPGGRPARHLCRLNEAGIAVAGEVAESAENATAPDGAARSRRPRRELRGAW